MQAKRVAKKSATKNNRTVNGANLANEVATKTSSLNTSNHGVKDTGGGMNRPILTNAQNTLNTTVWNSSIVREQATHPSPSVEKCDFFFCKTFKYFYFSELEIFRFYFSFVRS